MKKALVPASVFLVVTIVLLLPILSSVAAVHRPTPTPTPTPTPGPNGEVTKGTMVCLPKQKWLELNDWFNGLHAENTKAQTDLAAALKTNTTTAANLKQANTDLDTLKKEIGEGQQCVAHPLSFWFHRLMKHIFWIAGAIVVLLIVLVVINVMTGGALSGFFSIFGAIGRWVASLIKPKPPTPPVA